MVYRGHSRNAVPLRMARSGACHDAERASRGVNCLGGYPMDVPNGGYSMDVSNGGYSMGVSNGGYPPVTLM